MNAGLEAQNNQLVSLSWIIEEVLICKYVAPFWKYLYKGCCSNYDPFFFSLYVPFDETGKGVFESLQLVQAELAEERNRLASVKEKYDSLKVSYQKALESKKMSEKKLQDLKGSLNLAREKENDINHSNLALDLNGYQPRSLMEMEGLTSHRGTGKYSHPFRLEKNM